MLFSYFRTNRWISVGILGRSVHLPVPQSASLPLPPLDSAWAPSPASPGGGEPDENGGGGWSSHGSWHDHLGPVHCPGALGRLGNEDGGADGHVGQVSPTYAPLPLPQRCFQTTNGYLSDSRSCSSNYNVAALATSSLVGGYQLLSPGVCVVHPGH